MRFDPNHCGPGMIAGYAGHPSLKNVVWLDVKRRRLVASDGHMLASWPVKIEKGDTAGPIPMHAINEARDKGKADADGLVSVRLSKRFASVEGVKFERPETTELHSGLPVWFKACPEVDPGQPGTITFAFSPELLRRMFIALGLREGTGVVFTIPRTLPTQPPMDPIVVGGPGWWKAKNGPRAWLMPMAIFDEPFRKLVPLRRKGAP